MTRSDLIDLLLHIETQPEEREQRIYEFQEYMWHTETIPGLDENEQEILADLAYDLDFYEPNPEWRREDACFYGEERLIREIRDALAKLRGETR